MQPDISLLLLVLVDGSISFIIKYYISNIVDIVFTFTAPQTRDLRSPCLCLSYCMYVYIRGKDKGKHCPLVPQIDPNMKWSIPQKPKCVSTVFLHYMSWRRHTRSTVSGAKNKISEMTKKSNLLLGIVHNYFVNFMRGNGLCLDPTGGITCSPPPHYRHSLYSAHHNLRPVTPPPFLQTEYSGLCLLTSQKPHVSTKFSIHINYL